MALIMAVGVNLILDLWFIVGLKLGITGAAVATVLAQILPALLCMVYLRNSFPHLLLHNSGLYLGKLMVQGAVNTGGTEMISAYTATV